jgi:glutamate carboxypeptidase
LITSLVAGHDVTFSCERGGEDDSIRLTTSGAEVATLTGKGRASHAGNAPEQGRNALYEMAYQILKMRDGHSR